MKCLVIGGSSVDTLIHVPTIKTIHDDMSLWATNKVEKIGGTGAGKALCLDVLGYDVSLITDVGNDDYQQKIKAFFKTTKITLFPVKTDKSTAHTNLMHSQGKRLSVFTSYPSIIPDIHPDIKDITKEIDLVFLNINEFCRNYIPIVKQLNKPIIVDIHDYEIGNPYHQDFIDCADILVASGIHIKDQSEFLHSNITKGADIVIITNGSDGLVAMDKQYNEYKLKGYTDFTFVDSNGAGDAFVSGFATTYYETGNVEQSLLFGTICGGIACTSYDLYNREYDKQKILEIIKGNPL